MIVYDYVMSYYSISIVRAGLGKQDGQGREKKVAPRDASGEGVDNRILDVYMV